MKLNQFKFGKALALCCFAILSIDLAYADLADDVPKEAAPLNTGQPNVKTQSESSLPGQSSSASDKSSQKSGEQRGPSAKEGQKETLRETLRETQKDAPKEPTKSSLPGPSQNREVRPSKSQKSKKGVSGPPVKFRADSMNGNRFQGEVNLKGNVNITQGDLLIRGDQASIEQDPKLGQLVKVTVEGKVYLEKLDETTGKKITASAKSAIYSAPNRNITFKGDASITRGTDRMNGNIINYNLSNGVIKAEKVDGMIQQND